MDKSELEVWEYYMNYAESNYRAMINFGLTPEQARTVLPHSTKTELIMTANIREWLHIIKLRTSNAAHPQIKHLIGMVAEVLAINYPSIFDNV
jgi:thymidylate synthase (FAD)